MAPSPSPAGEYALRWKGPINLTPEAQTVIIDCARGVALCSAPRNRA
jgi:hypothetical protein